MMLSLHELWLLLSLDAALAVLGTLSVAYVFGFLGGGPGPRTTNGHAVGGEDRSGGTGPRPGEVCVDGTSTDPGWYEEAVDLAGEVRRTASRFDPPADPDRVSRRMLPLSARLRGHVRSAPATVETDVYRRLYELAVACQRVAVEGRPIGTGYGPLDERLESIRDEAGAFETRASAAG